MQLFTQYFCALIVLIGSCYSHASWAESAKLLPTRVDWAYHGKTGPNFWSKLDPSYALCSQGKNQSPIDIPAMKPTVLSKLRLNYMPLANSDLATPRQVTEIISNHTLTLNFAKALDNNTIQYEDNIYKLVQLHIHTPSEHTLGGKEFPAEIHFIHTNEEGQIAMLGVWVILGPMNPVIEQMIKHMPKVAGKEVSLIKEPIDPANLLPAKHAHYQYIGSIALPPCTEGVQWFIMANPITASAKQIAKLKSIAPKGNARPIQVLNDRPVEYAYIAS